MLHKGRRGTLLLSRRNARIDTLVEIAQRRGTPVRRVAEAELDRLCGHRRHRGALLALQADPPKRAPARRRQADPEQSPGPMPGLRSALAALPGPDALVLLLDELSDPHNLGAILRSADQFAVPLVITTARRSVSETETVVRTSAGASVYVDLLTVPNLVQAMELCKRADFWIVGADPTGESVERLKLAERVALVLGSEGRGLRRLVRERCDFLACIPQRGHVGSFNVSVAAGILMYEIRRQQGFLAPQ
jgi:23S rRNA (guanosine2251-2'-O)-methyltransferase